MGILTRLRRFIVGPMPTEIMNEKPGEFLTNAIKFRLDQEPLNVKDRKIDEIVMDLLQQQHKKGMDTYGVTLDDAPYTNHEWRTMALEEMVDMSKYLIKELKRVTDITERQRKEYAKLSDEYDQLSDQLFKVEQLLEKYIGGGK